MAGALGSGLSPKQRLFMVAVVEVVYWTGTRIALQHFKWDSIEAESIRLALRCSTALIDWLLCRGLIASRVLIPGAYRHPVLVLSFALFLLASATTLHPKLPPAFALLFGVGSIAVALKEEFLFRGIVQNLLRSRFGDARSVFVTSIVFTAWHYGVVPASSWPFIQIFMAGTILGFIYVRTGSIWAVVVLHALYDAMFAIPNLVTSAHGNGFAFLELLTALALVTCF